ncbi:single-stranded-DNA-specific exonuclease RecJ [Tepidibacillus marianensis]|uniref:single-stranded-DNA-specific exonuclease RecJ n=1 Tax=Tepidibacillus marianensis TaxID=3131995 RepID=UPI0030D02E17
MIQPKKRWFIQDIDRNIVDQLVQEYGLDPIVARLLAIRGIKERETIDRFLNQDISLLHDPFLFLAMKKAVDRVHTAIVKGEKILIYGDYDADGVTSTTIMYKTLKQLGANFDYYIPNRFTEGYGLNKDALEAAAQKGFQVVITVDTGISAVDEADLAKKLGLDLIITDHHEPQQTLPDAFAILNPKTPGETYPFKLLAGVGVAFKYSHALLGRVPTDYLDIAAIGTIGDLVPLLDENRIIASNGLNQLTQTKHIGLQAMIEESGLTGKKITAGHVGFVIAPRINASGRLETADHAVRLFIAEDHQVAKELAEVLGSINQERQGIVEQITKEAFDLIEQQGMQNDQVLVIAKENWNVGVIGIVASRIVEKYYRPTIILHIDPETKMAKGSARSIAGYDIFQALTEAKDLLPHYGGHPAAAGLSIKEEDIPLLRQKLNQLAVLWLREEDFIPVEKVDMVCSLEQITIPLIEQIERMEPFGMGNPTPKWMIEQIEVNKVATIGNEKQHLKLIVTNQSRMIEALAFKMGHLNKEIAASSEIQLLGELNINEWNGERKPQIMVRDLQIASVQIFDRQDYRDTESLLKELDHPQTVILFDQDIHSENLATIQKARKISYQNWKEYDGQEIRQLILYHLPVSVRMMEKILGQLSTLENIYFLYGHTDDNSRNRLATMPSRQLFKQVYTQLKKYPELKEKKKAEHYFKKIGISSETFQFILDVFLELGFIIVDGDLFTLHPNPIKKELTQSATYLGYVEMEKVREQFLNSNPKTVRDWFKNTISKRN